MAHLTGILGLVLATTGVAAAPEKGKQGRRLMSSGGSALWGECRVYYLLFPGCQLREPFTCASRESPGPEHANTEVELRGLPASSAGSDVFLQFFAAFESTSPYDPTGSILPASVYPNISVAYPRYDDAAFNGGNVRVDENGTATVRFLAPASYLVPGLRVMPLPRLHLRLCMEINNKNVLLHPDEIIWALDSYWWSNTLKWFFWWPHSVKYLPNQTTEREYSIPQPSTQLGQVLIDDAAGGLEEDLDTSVLVFSPVYQCLADGRFYNQFDQMCAEECPDGAAIIQGQCVQRRVASEAVTLGGTWKVQVDCESSCENLTSTASHHTARLEVAGHLDIPFQEVKVMVQMGATVDSRRLAEETLSLTVEVKTRRWTAAQGQEQLEALLQSTESASAVLEYPVQAISMAGAETMQQGEADKDPFEPAYDAVAPLLQDDGPSSGNGTDFPVWAIGVIVAGSVVAGVLLGLFLFLFWQRRRSQAEKKAEADRKAANSSAQAEEGEANDDGSPGGTAPPEQPPAPPAAADDVNATM